MRATSDATRASLRPVQAPRGAKRIDIDPLGTPKELLNDARALGFADPTLPRHIVTVALVTTPECAIELRTAASEVFVQDKFGALRMLKPRAKAFLKRGEVLFFAWSKARGTRFGYVLDVGDGGGEDDGAKGAGGGRGAAEVIDIASEEDASGTPRRRRGDGASERAEARGEAEAGTRSTRRESGAHGKTSPSPSTTTSEGTRRSARNARKASAPEASAKDENVDDEDGDEVEDDVIEVENDDWTHAKRRREEGSPATASSSQAARQSRSNKDCPINWARARGYGKPNLPPREAETCPHDYAEPPRREEPSMWGGQQGREEARQQAEAARIPPCPPEGLPDDPTELQNARTALKQAHRQLVSALNTEVAMRQTLAQCQLDFQRTMRGGADYALRQWHKDNLQIVAGKYQQSQFAAAAARSSYQHALKLFHRTVERCEGLRTGADASASPAASPMSKQRQKPEEPTASAATKSRFDAECEAWDTLLSVDPTKMSIKDLRRCATDVGIDVSTLVEREDYVNALTKKRDTGQAAFNEKKRKRDEERAAVEAKQRAKKASEEEDHAKRAAVHQVSIWAMHADLRLFLYRCGVSIDQHGRSTKRLLQKSYRQAMLKFHPDRARQKSIREQALANEVTKWLTHAWQQLPP